MSSTEPCVQLWPARDVPLGGIRHMTVSRTLPQRELPTVGAWCFLDSFGPAPAQMAVPSHPHIGLQTVTWPLTGTIRHRDSLGSDVIVRPGELNLMTAGHGVAHSEFSWLADSFQHSDPAMMRGIQLWVALPEESREQAAGFEQHRQLPTININGIHGTVMVGELAGVQSPATVFSPIMGAELRTDSGGSLPLRADFEYALLVLDGEIELDGVTIPAGPLAYLGANRESLNFQATPHTRLLLLGGEPFAEDLVMWWNFVARSHEEIEQARADWESRSTRFPEVSGDSEPPERIPAPALPGVRLKPRARAKFPPSAQGAF